MATFVHLLPEPLLKRVLRNGIRMSRPTASTPAGVFAMPVMRSFYASHQWLRELKSSGAHTVAAVYFRVADELPVWVGHYASQLSRLTAAQASALIGSASSAEGYQVLIPCRIEPDDILRSRRLSQVLGWRYFPGSHGHPPCDCPVCAPKGTPKAHRTRERVASSNARPA